MAQAQRDGVLCAGHFVFKSVGRNPTGIRPIYQRSVGPARKTGNREKSEYWLQAAGVPPQKNIIS